MSSDGRSLHFSDRFVISCGTVTVDAERGKVLLVRYRKTGEYFLPKGRKNVSESLEQTAVRETFEETGINVQLLPVRMVTLATSPSSINVKDCCAPVTEPIAVTQRVTNGVLKIIFWYIASADSTAIRVVGTQEDDEDFDTVWDIYENASLLLSFEDDQKVAHTSIGVVRDMKTSDGLE